MKQITITDSEITFNKPYDIYEVYTDWVAINNDEPSMTDEEVRMCEDIRDYYEIVFENVPEGSYTLKEFEALALEIIEN